MVRNIKKSMIYCGIVNRIRNALMPSLEIAPETSITGIILASVDWAFAKSFCMTMSFESTSGLAGLAQCMTGQFKLEYPEWEGF